MPVSIIRGLFFLACVVMGALWGQYLFGQNYPLGAVTEAGTEPSATPWIFGGGLAGGLVGLGVLLLLVFVTQEIYERIAPALVSVCLAMVIGYFVGQYILFWLRDDDITLRIFVVVSFVLIFGFAGISLGITRASNWESLLTAVERNRRNAPVTAKIVDTSVLIDGRIQDICDSGFVEGTLLVPRFVLHELQHIADASDVLRRAKGRRGLDILKKLQGVESKVTIEIMEEDPQEIREVDAKLVKLASKYGAKVLTTDFNLNKVAQIEGVQVLNINDLANALKPAALPDERMRVKIIKEGKEQSQGVGYLDDGTMIVVDGGREHMGKTVDVIVTSVLQTAAGRMIFTRYDQEAA
ncbi:MAG: TRAM domain-containing protein [Candidatus Hydrogenedens sp.]|nr:TRAM domain-containing protein [Candidatus Hydrogenedens sp.]